MKKLLLAFSLILTTTAMFAQGAKAKISLNDLPMCDKEWKIVSVEEWGVVSKPPADKNKNDMVKLGSDGNFTLVMFGTNYSGTWVKSGASIAMTDAATKKRISFKVLSSTATNLKVDHYSDEDGHSTFEFETK